MRTRTVVFGLLLIGPLAACGGGEAPPPPPPVPTFGAQSGYARVSGEILDWYLSRHPALATSIGEHAYDTTLGSYFPGDLERAKRDARALLTRLEGVNRPTLARPDYFDHRLLEYGLRAELLDLEEIGGWQRDPVRYVELVGAGVQPLVQAELPLEGKLASMAARWRSVPLVFRAARQNLVAARVPALYVRKATMEARRVADWMGGPIESDLAAQGLTSMPAARRAQWDAARRVAIASTDSFATWLEQDLGPRATGDFRLGADNLERLLAYEHQAEVPLDQLQQVNRQAIAEYREWLDRIALDVDPLRHPEEIIANLVAGDPDASYVVPASDVSWQAPESRARRVFFSSALPGEAAHFFDLAALETESTNDADRLVGIRRALHAHALIHAMIMLHAGNGTIDGVAEDIANIAMIGREQAREEAMQLAYDPSTGLTALGRMQLFALREQVRAARAGALDQRAFMDELLELGLPVPLAAEAMLGHEPQPLLVVGRRTPGIPEPSRRLQ